MAVPLLALLLGAVPALAQQPSAKLCLDPNLGTAGQSGCLKKASDEADRKLNAAYGKAISVIDRDPDRTAAQKTEWKKQLATAQRAWIAFRDADCSALTALEWNNGTGAGPASQACVYDKTVERTQDLLSRYPLH